jgi:hypothetical protein
MSNSNPSFDQILPLPESLAAQWRKMHSVTQDLKPKAFPASITSVDSTGTIVKVKFEILEPGTNPAMQDLHPLYVLQWPETEMPVATDLYGIPPLQVGDKGYCVPADVDLGAVSGYYDTVATLSPMPNLATLVFHPIGNVKANQNPDQTKYFLSGPSGVILQDLSGVATVIVGPVEGGPKNVMQLNTLIPASSDVDAKSKGVPLGGLYHNNGTVRYQFTVP